MKLGILSLCVLIGLFFTLSANASTSLCYSFYGVSGDLLTNIQQHLQLDKHNCVNNLTIEKIHHHFMKSEKWIKEALEPYGYFKPVIHGHLTKTRGHWIAVFNIIPGAPVRIAGVKVEVSGPGKDNQVIQAALSKIPIKRGDVFNTPIYSKAKEKLFAIARNQGYIKSFFKNSILIDPKQNTCQITIHLETGERYYFGEVIFESDTYAKSFLCRFLNFSPGEPFSSFKLLQLQQAMEHSYYFRQAIITPDFDHITHNQVPVHIEFVLPKAKKYNVGFGYGTLTGPRLSAGLSLRRVTNTGQHFEADMKLSSVLSVISTNYYIPGNDPLTETYLLGANAKKFRPNAGKSDSITLTAGYLLDQKNTRESFTINYLVDRFVIHPLSPVKSHLFYPDFKFIYFTADDLAKPRNGFSFTFNLEGSSQQIFSTTRYVQSLIDSKFIFSPFPFSRFIFHGELGYTAVHQLPKFPLSQRFFAGGIDSIRGFADSSIGPGRYLEIGSVEYQNKIVGDFNAALFYDVGTAANHFHRRMNRGAGIGGVYYTIIGPIKLYLARAISKRTQPYSVEFSVGPEFS